MCIFTYKNYYELRLQTFSDICKYLDFNTYEQLVSVIYPQIFAGCKVLPELEFLAGKQVGLQMFQYLNGI